MGYLLGGIPTGMVLARAYHVDLTQVGSKRTGATNVLRTLGWPAALATASLFALVGAVLWLWIGADRSIDETSARTAGERAMAAASVIAS